MDDSDKVLEKLQAEGVLFFKEVVPWLRDCGRDFVALGATVLVVLMWGEWLIWRLGCHFESLKALGAGGSIDPRCLKGGINTGSLLSFLQLPQSNPNSPFPMPTAGDSTVFCIVVFALPFSEPYDPTSFRGQVCQQT